MSIGLARAGFAHTALYEMDKHSVATLRRNRPDWNVVEADIRNVDFKRYRKQQIALVAGGVPCQPYSADGHGLGKDDPRDLLLEAVRIVREVRPKAFLLENVTGLLQPRHADHLTEVLRRFRRAGYQTEIHRLEANDFGIAQDRTRILIIGLRKELAGSLRLPPAFPHRSTNLGEVLQDLMAENGWTGAAAWARARREHPINDKSGNIVGRGARASTLVTSQGKRRQNDHASWQSKGVDMSKLPIHAPTDEEASVDGVLPGLTARMRARLQNLPDDWEFSGGKAATVKQIGNAVPPRLAQAAGLAIYAAVTNVAFEWESLLWPDEPKRLAVNPPSLDTDLAPAPRTVAPLSSKNSLLREAPEKLPVESGRRNQRWLRTAPIDPKGTQTSSEVSANPGEIGAESQFERGLTRCFSSRISRPRKTKSSRPSRKLFGAPNNRFGYRSIMRRSPAILSAGGSSPNEVAYALGDFVGDLIPIPSERAVFDAHRGTRPLAIADLLGFLGDFSQILGDFPIELRRFLNKNKELIPLSKTQNMRESYWRVAPRRAALAAPTYSVSRAATRAEPLLASGRTAT